MRETHSPAASTRNSMATCWMLATLGTLITYVGAQFSAPLPFTPVPVTFQVFGVLLCGLMLGRRWGAIAQAQYLALGFLGAPVFALHFGGASVLFWPHVTGGYLLSYPIAAYVIGAIKEHGTKDGDSTPSLQRALLACGAGLGIIYGFGCSWLALMSRPMLSPGAALIAGAGWFFAWDAVKALGAAAIVTRLSLRALIDNQHDRVG